MNLWTLRFSFWIQHHIWTEFIRSLPWFKWFSLFLVFLLFLCSPYDFFIFLPRYLRCCPSCQSLWQPKTNTMSSLASVFLNNLQNIPHLFTKKPLKVVMFGPGLESKTKSLTHTILWGTKSPFKVTGLFPGEFEGKDCRCAQYLQNKIFLQRCWKEVLHHDIFQQPC